MKNINPKNWFPNLDRAIADGEVPAFPTKKAALQAAKEFGWHSAIRIVRRFEKIWVVGDIDFQPDIENGIEFRKMRISLLRWERRADGIVFCPVAFFRAPWEA